MKFRSHLAATAAILIAAALPQSRAADAPAFRPPAVPLVTFDPYLSIWSGADHLNDNTTRHWTRKDHPLVSLIRIDGKAYRLMGNDPAALPAFPQQSVLVLPTRSIYEFDDGHVHVTMTFMTAALPLDLDAFARPLSYINWDVRSVDGKAHAVSVYDSTSALLAVSGLKQSVEWSRESTPELAVLKVGSKEQPMLSPPGDDTRIGWGYAYTAANAQQCKAAIGGNGLLLNTFIAEGVLPTADDSKMPRGAMDDQPVLAIAFDLGQVEAQPVSRHVTVAYDEVFAIRYFGQKLRPYWRRNGASAVQMLEAAEAAYPALVEKCTAFDKELMADLEKAGGPRYATMGALAYRQCTAACGLAADANGQPLYFTKENTSNGDIATVDVFYPMDPMFLLLSPTLAKATVVPILQYAASPRWKFPNAPHDLGVYPVARGTDDGGEGMPVEESGNMLLLCLAIAKADGNADFVTPWWPKLTQWALYLEKYGLDPENQLCTDDFMGHLAHNANLSVKAILGLAAYGELCKMRGDDANSKKYADLAKVDAAHWVKVAADGDHFRLAFDKPNTWSQKYNLVWDQILNLNVFPPEVARTEVAFYKSVMQKYGVPLDSRTKLTKTDWSFWSATLAEHQSDFEAIIFPIQDYLNETATRDPFADSYETNNAKGGGMHARPVIGGIFIKMLADPELWKKWASRDKNKVGNWAPLPERPAVTETVPARKEATWRYTFEKPEAAWNSSGFDDKGWKQGPGALGSRGTPGLVASTQWKSPDVWLRREITLPSNFDPSQLQFLVYHDEDVEIYVDGVLAATEGGFVNSYEAMEIRPLALALLKPGAKVTLAVHCHQTEGGQGVDVGLVTVMPAK